MRVGQCGYLGNPQLTQCPHCQSDEVLPMHLARATRGLRPRGDGDAGREAREVAIHDDTCPVCGQRGGQLIGAQTTSLAAHAVERLWSAPLNDHKKLILFSDAVQDAAHRAGYIESKTEGYLVRAGLAQAMATLPPVLPWDQALDALGRCYLDPASPLALSPRDFVARFIPPTMEWLRDWRELTARGTLAMGSRLPEMLGQRMQWRAIEELAHRSDRGRTLSRVGIAVLSPALADLAALSRTLMPELRQAGGGLEALTEEGVLFWATGTVLMLIQAGAIFHLGLEQVAETGDFDRFQFTKPRSHWIPHRGRAEAPHFLSREAGRYGFPHLEERDGNPLIRWAQLALGLALCSPGIVTLAYEELLKALEAAGLGRFVQREDRGNRARVFGLVPSRLNLYRGLRRLVTPTGSQALWVPEDAAEAMSGLPAWNSPGETLRPEAVIGEN